MMPRETRKRKLRDTGGTEIQLYDCLLDGYLQDQLLQWFGSIVDITNLALTSKAFYAMTRCHTPLYKTIAARNLGPLVQNFGFRDTQHFDNFLDSTDLTLSGSLMLQCLLGEKWEDSDMDLYLSYYHRKTHLKRIREALASLEYVAKYVVKNYSHFSPVFKCIGFSNGVKTIQIIVG